MPLSLIASRSTSNNISPKSKDRWIKDDIISNNLNPTDNSDYTDDKNMHDYTNQDSASSYATSNHSIIIDNSSVVTSSSNNNNVNNINSHSSDLLWMLVDGIGLAIVAGATIMEGIHLWKEFFHSFWNTYNNISIIFWVLGRSCQVFGIVILIAYAATFQLFAVVERIGMFFITIGPLFNMTACYLFRDQSDPFHLFNKQWICSECVELCGMLILDVSLLHMQEILVLTAEVTGFFALCCAAIIQFDFLSKNIYPYISLRCDIVHVSECFGLMLLTIVAFAQYRIKTQKHEKSEKKKIKIQLLAESINNHHHHKSSIIT